MRKILIAALFLFLAGRIEAQTQTLVSGTLVDPSGVAYYPATVKACLSPSTLNPTVGGNAVNPNPGSNYCVGPTSTSNSGFFSMALWPNANIVPASTTWIFTVQASGAAPPAGNGTLNFSSSGITISGATQDVGTTVSAAGTVQLKTSGGLSSVSPSVYQTGLIGYYQALPTDTIASLKDYSGAGNDATGTVGTAPTLVANTGGISCPGNGAIALPATLNSAVTIQLEIGFQPAGLAQGFYAPVMGNGTPATSGVGIVIQTTTANPAATSFGSFVNNFSGGGVRFDQGIAEIAGIQDVAIVLSAADTLYNNGFATSSGSVGNGLNKQTTGVYALCGAAGGAGNTSQTYFNGKIYSALFYSGALNSAQIFQNHVALQQAMLARGINPLPYRSDTGDLVWAYGDSTTAGAGFISWPTRAVGLNGTWSVANLGISGIFASQLNLGALGTGGSTCSTAGGRSAVVLLTGANDSVATTVFGNIRGIFGQLTTAPCGRQSRIVMTMMDKGSSDAFKNATNLLIRKNCSNIADYCIDLGGTVALGADGAASNASYFQGDFLHPTQAGADVLTWITQRGINRYFGNHNLSTANVYVAPASAAVAVTAASETGNVMTFTTAANTFTAGQCITVAGITPTTYNSTFANSAGLGCWYALSVTATSFTAWNQNTAIGTLSVAGTAVAPQQVDADQAAILNFGAGNFTLQSCEGLTMDDITRITNINAVASTLVPFGTQTINGAANSTLAANSTAILQAQLVSPAAGGCNWLRLQ